MPRFDRLTVAAIALVLLSSSAAAAPKDVAPTTVFDLTLGTVFGIRECNYEVVSVEMGSEGVAVGKRNRGLFGRADHVARRYRYTEATPATDKCFQRVGPFYTGSAPPGVELPAVVPPNNQKVKLVYSAGLRPAIADREDIWVGIQDTKLTGIRFYFQNNRERSVYETLVKKYGPSAPVERFTLQTAAGTVKTFYSARWTFSNLKVTFLSLDTNQIGYDPDDAPIGDRSDIGSVTIQYVLPEAAHEDRNPL